MNFATAILAFATAAQCIDTAGSQGLVQYSGDFDLAFAEIEIGLNIKVRWPSTRKSRASNRRSRNSRRGTKSKAVKPPPGGWKISFSPNFFTMGLAQIQAERILDDFEGSSDGDESSDD